MSGRSAIVLIGVLAALVGLYWTTGRIEQANRREAFEARRLFAFNGSDITSLSVQRRGEEPVSAMRGEGAAWSIVEPYDTITASQPVWEYISNTVAQLSNQRAIETDSTDLSVYGLDDPHLSIIAGTPDGILQITFGSLEPTQAHRYVRVTGDDVVLVSERSVQEMNRSLRDLRDRRLITLAPKDIAGLELTQRPLASDSDPEAPEPELIHAAFDLDTAGAWRMTVPSEGPADQNALNTLAVGLLRLEGRAYVDAPESLGDYGLSSPVYEVTVHSRTADPQTVSIGWMAGLGEDGGYYAKRENSPSVFIVDRPLVDVLANSHNLYRESRLFTRAATDLRAIHYQDNRTEITLENDPESGWSMTKPAVNDTDQQSVSMFIAGLKQLRAVAFPDEAAATGLDPPRIRLEFEFAGTDETTTIEVGGLIPEARPFQFYARQDNGTIAAIPLEAQMVLSLRPFDFRRRAIFSFSPEHADKLVLSLDGVDYVFDKGAEGWGVTEPAGRTLESQDDIEGLLETLSSFEALDIADPPPSEAVHGLDTPVLTATVDFSNPANPRARTVIGPLTVGNLKAPQSRERFVTIRGRSDVYYMDQGVIDAIRSALRGVISAG